MIAEPLLPLARPIADLRVLDGNPRRGDVQAVKRSLQRFGQRKPIVVRADGTVTAGNHTLLAARELGWAEIAAVGFDDDDATAKAYALADNRTSELGSFDMGDLAAMAAEVHAVDPELLEAASFTEADLNALLAGEKVPPKLNDPDDVPEPPTDPVTQPGDVWLLGPHRLICGDCRDFETVERLLGGARVNVAFTSPPYASQRAYDESSGFRPIPPDEYVDWFHDVQANVRTVLADDGSWFVNIKEHAEDGERHRYVLDLFVDHISKGWRYVDCLVWQRPGFPINPASAGRFKNAWEPVQHFTLAKGHKFRPDAVMVESDNAFTYDPSQPMQGSAETGFLGVGRGGKSRGLAYPSNVLPSFGVASTGTAHSAAFPVALPAWFMKAYCDPGDVVFDPFMGSGSTLIAAHQEGRTAYGTEISPAYCDVICRRYQEHTGSKPILEATGQPHDFAA